MVKKIFFALAFVVVGVISFFVGEKVNQQKEVMQSEKIIPQAKNLSNKKGLLINPLLQYEINQDIFAGELKSFTTTVQRTLDQEKQSGNIIDAAVYFRDLQDGPWFSINGNKDFAPASLLKVPVMLAFYKQAESNPTILDKKIIYDDSFPFDDQNTESYFKPQKSIQKGNTYTVNELINYMILYSDNNAKDLLQLNLAASDEGKVYTDLGLANIIELQNPQTDVLSAIDYSTIIRVLYNASYLNIAMSEKALELLSHSTFAQGISLGVPKGTIIAHKFGERTIGDIKQLHDCGIIYYPRNPYLLCVMTRGKDFSQLSEAIKDISQVVWTEVDQQIKSYSR